MTEDEVSEFIIERLAELVVALLDEHVGAGPSDTKARADAYGILYALGRLAERQGRSDMAPRLLELSQKVASWQPANSSRRWANGSVQVNFASW